MSFDPKVIEALAQLRHAAAQYDLPVNVKWAINALDEAGVFAALDEQTDYAAAEEILAEGAAIDMVRRSNPNVPADKALQVLHNTWHPERTEADPAEWGDTTRADMARHQGYAAVSRLGKLERVPGTDTLVPAHEHVFRSPHSDEVCYGAEWCTVTYREHRLASVKVGYPVPETVSDEWAARARAIEDIRPKGLQVGCACGGVGPGCVCDND
jgi:hypothetical protein